MYNPEQFKECDKDKVIELIHNNPLGLFVTCINNQPVMNHYPFIYEAKNGLNGTLIGHMAKANDQWKILSFLENVTVIFNGPQGYVSPSWYASAGVPTWNYATVQLQGKPRLIETFEGLDQLLQKMTETFESKSLNPWEYKLTTAKKQHLLQMIVGFEIEITQIDAKFKLSQNRPLEDQVNVIKQLSNSDDYQALDLSKFMRRFYE